MMTSYTDTDVADKAKFYYSLMTGASDPKLKLVLCDMKFSKDNIQQALSSILPGTTEKSNLAKIIPIENTMFEWERISETTSTLMLEKPRTLNKQLPEENEDLIQYVEYISKYEVCLNINCRLSLRGSSEFETVHAVTVRVDPSNHFHDVPDIHVACLSRNNHCDIQIKLRPILPVPQKLSFQLDFTCDKKQTFTLKLPPLELHFQQFLLTLPWKPSHKQTMFFTHFWKWVCFRSHGISASDGIETVKSFEMIPERFEKIHNQHLHTFLVGNKHDYSFSEYAIFLPPHHHILLRCQGHKDNRLVVSVAMDTWTLLPHVDKLLNTFISE